MTRTRAALLILVSGMPLSPCPLLSQQAAGTEAASLILNPPGVDTGLTSVTVPDSIRQRVGYQHWKGAAIGGGVGALVGLVLAVAAHGACSDCPSDSPSLGKTTLAGAGLGGAFGFLVGLASPRYRWVRTDGE